MNSNTTFVVSAVQVGARAVLHHGCELSAAAGCARYRSPRFFERLGLTLRLLSAPVLVGFARDSGCLRVFDFYPMIGPARAIRRAEALRHDALAAEGRRRA